MTNPDLIPSDPAKLAAPRAEDMVRIRSGFEIDRILEEEWLANLEAAADQLGYLGLTYFVDSNRSLSLPVLPDTEQPLRYFDFVGLAFEGEFVAYSKVAIGKIVGAHAVRALCLTFNNVTLLPYFDGLPEDHLLHVPVLAVNSMSAQTI